MSWFQERAYYTEHMRYREKNPTRYIKKYGTNRHTDHSKVLSTDLLTNQVLVDKIYHQIMSVLPNKRFALTDSIEVYFNSTWQEYGDNDRSVIGVSLDYTLLQFKNELRKGRLLLANWGNRGEPASVYDDAFSRFLLFEIRKPNSSTQYNGLTQYGFHKYLNSKYKKMSTDYKLLGVKKENKSTILHLLQTTFELKVEGDNIELPLVEISNENEEQLLNLLKQLLIIGLTKEYTRKRINELSL
ncbi:hypothetical protein [Rossellomorea sp. NPDC077527]|uniref:hypothetical protein n=1 Tax=Rossellomorea sp. NPDC077527 TaxID=3364510 RepID=UPI0037CC31C6